MRLRYRISFQRSDDRPDESSHGFQAPPENPAKQALVYKMYGPGLGPHFASHKPLHKPV